MILNERALPPAFIVEAIPGAEPLNAAAAEARQTINTTAVELRIAGDALRAKILGPVDDWTPRPGVTSADATTAADAYRMASHAQDEAQRAYQRTLRQLHEHLRTGMATPDFVAAQEGIADAAHDTAVAALAALRQALKDRDLADGLLPRQRKVRGGTAYGVSYLLDQIDEHVNALVVDTMTGAIADLEQGIRTPQARISAAKRLGVV